MCLFRGQRPDTQTAVQNRHTDLLTDFTNEPHFLPLSALHIHYIPLSTLGQQGNVIKKHLLL